MRRGPPFIDRRVFEETLGKIERARGGSYQDVGTIYGDMSRLVVAWLATTSVEEIVRTYNELGWGGMSNARALHEAALDWMEPHHPEMMDGTSDSPG
jgi:hypothetical protein